MPYDDRHPIPTKTDARPFQFSIRAILVFTVLVAALAWLISGVEEALHPYPLAYLLVGVGQVGLIVGITKRLSHAERESRLGGGIDPVWLGFFLSIPTWLVYVAGLICARLDFSVEYIPIFEIAMFTLALQVGAVLISAPAMIITAASLVFRSEPLHDWPLVVLPVLNLANSAIVFIVIYEFVWHPLVR